MLFITDAPSAPTPDKAASSNETVPKATSTFTNETPGATSNNTSNMAGAIIGSMIGGSLLTIGSFFLYKKYKKHNKDKNETLTSVDNKNNFNSRQILENESKINSNTEVYNHEHEVIPITENENQVHNHTIVYNHGQEAVLISENNNNS
jgi:hypothetical protein